jgi:hypothetical protein
MGHDHRPCRTSNGDAERLAASLPAERDEAALRVLADEERQAAELLRPDGRRRIRAQQRQACVMEVG